MKNSHWAINTTLKLNPKELQCTTEAFNTNFKPTLFNSIRIAVSDLESSHLVNDTAGWLATEIAERTSERLTLKGTVSLKRVHAPHVHALCRQTDIQTDVG